MSAAEGFACFDTSLGTCAIAWGLAGVVGVQLPEASETATRRRMQRRFPRLAEAMPPPEVADAVGAIQGLLRGDRVNLQGIRLDMAGVPDFHQRAYALARTLAVGETLTYGEMARRLGEPDAARAVGRAMGSNPFAPVVPCHRVLAAGGRSGGFSAPGGAQTKLRMLAIEGAAPNGQPSLF